MVLVAFVKERREWVLAFDWLNELFFLWFASSVAPSLPAIPASCYR